MMRRLGISSIALALVVLPAAMARAQIGGSGSIQGSILDASGAALPGATVTATHVSTGVETVRQATGAGVYTVSPLAPGEYRVPVGPPGFQPPVQGSGPGGAPGVVGLNVTLKVGGITQEVTVSATPPMLRTADARLGQTIRNEVYTALPLVMNTGGPRDPTAFMFLMPGVQSVGRWGNVMGGQDFTNDTYVEGVPITNAVVQGEGRNLSFGISVEAVDQFQVETSGTAVMYNGQGASNYVVKSGTNQFRGSAFEFFRNKALDAKAFFAAAKPDDNQHEFGFTARRTDPPQPDVLLRRLRRLSRSPADRVAADLDPDGGQRNGDFSALPVVIYDPATTRPNPNGTGFVRDPFPGNIIPADRISPISRYFQSFLPAPDQRQPAEQLPRRLAADRVQQRQRHGEGRPELSSRHQASVLFAHGKRSQATPYRGGGNAQTALPLPYTETRLVEEIADHRAGQAHLRARRAMGEPGQPRVLAAVGADLQRDDRRPLSDRGGTPRPAAGEADSAFPEVAFRRAERADAMARHRRARVHRVPEQLHVPEQPAVDARQARDDVRLPGAAHGRQRARAHLRQPGDVRLQQRADRRLQRDRHALTATGNAYASFLLGDLNATNVIEDSEVATSGRFYTYAFWAQDDFKVTPRPDAQPRPALRHHEAVHRGLRSLVVHESRPAEPGGRRAPGRVQFAGDGPNSCQCRTPIKTYYGNVGPRLGVAYSLNDAHGAARAPTASCTRGRGAVGGRAGARNGTGTLGFSANASFPSPNGFSPAYNWNNGVPVVSAAAVLRSDAQRRLRHRARQRRRRDLRRSGDRRPSAALPELERGLAVRADPTITVGAAYAGSRGDFLGGSGRGFFANQLDPRYLVLGNLLTQHGDAANIAAAQAIVPDVAVPYPNFSGTIGQMLRPFPQMLGRDRRLRQRRVARLPLAAAHGRAAAIERRA